MNTLSIRTDLMSNAIQQNLSYSTDKFNQAMQRLASGLKINSAKDGAANLNISTKMGSTISGLAVANSNINTGISTLSTINSTYDLITTELQKIRDLAIQASNGTYSAEDCAAINEESNQLIDEINRLIKKSNSSLPTSDGSTGFIDYVDKMTKTQALAAGYDEAHIITSAAEFVAKISANRTGNFILVNDIDMSELGTLSSSAITETFTGTFDGNGYSVDNLSISNSSSTIYNIGLFSLISASATIKNLAMSNATVNAANASYVGALCGRISGAVTNCKVSATVTGRVNVGGLVGYASGTTIKNSSASGNVICALTGTSNIGGLVGQVDTATISNSYSSANVQGTLRTGGIVGQVIKSTISHTFASGNVKGGNQAGGLIGIVTNPIGSDISYSYSTGNVSGGNTIGGFIGEIQPFNGISNTVISHCYSTGALTATSFAVAGFIARSASPNITYCYNTGKITGNASGFVASVSGGAINNTNYWDVQTTGKTTSAGGVGVTTEELNELIAEGTWDDAGYHSEGGRIMLQTGTESTDTYTINNLKIDIDLSGVDLSDATKASNSLSIIDSSFATISKQSTSLGSSIKMLENKIDVNSAQSINLTQSNSTLKDADTAEETVQLVQQQILQQTNAYLLNENRGRLKEILLDLIEQG